MIFSNMLPQKTKITDEAIQYLEISLQEYEDE